MLSLPPTLISSALLVAMQIQPIIHIEYTERYDINTNFSSAYVKVQEGKTNEFQLKNGLIYKGIELHTRRRR